MPTNDKKYMWTYMYWEKWYMKSKKRKSENATRKRARYKFVKEWKVSKFDWKEVDHKKWVSKWNWKKNLRVLSRKKNRQLWVAKANKNMKKKKTRKSLYI